MCVFQPLAQFKGRHTLGWTRKQPSAANHGFSDRFPSHRLPRGQPVIDRRRSHTAHCDVCCVRWAQAPRLTASCDQDCPLPVWPPDCGRPPATASRMFWPRHRPRRLMLLRPRRRGMSLLWVRLICHPEALRRRQHRCACRVRPLTVGCRWPAEATACIIKAVFTMYNKCRAAAHSGTNDEN